MPTLHLEVHYEVDLASDATVLAELCTALVDLNFGSSARVAEYEGDRAAVDVRLDDPETVHRVIVEKGCQRGPLFHELSAAAPTSHPRRFGDVMLRGQPTGTWLRVRFDEYRPAMPMGDKWLFSNSVSFTTNKRRLGGESTDRWLTDLFSRLATNHSVVWGGVWDDAEFRWSNLHDEADGMRALGRDMRQSLPGIFWLNAFGRPYVELIGHNRLMSTPADRVVDVGSTVVVQTYALPEDWATDEVMVLRSGVLDHLGRQYFYDRAAPSRVTAAPNFGLPELARGERVQVLTADGKTFTVIPTIE